MDLWGVLSNSQVKPSAPSVPCCWQLCSMALNHLHCGLAFSQWPHYLGQTHVRTWLFLLVCKDRL